LPDGTAWAYLGAKKLLGIVDRSVNPREARSLYRGCAGMSSRTVQAVEGAILCEIGWGLLDLDRDGEDLGDRRVRFSAGDSVWEAQVTAGRRLPVPVCGAPIESAVKYEDELVVSGLSLAPKPGSQQAAGGQPAPDQSGSDPSSGPGR
ncbi:MAG: hypothetical protein ACRD0B_08165, partial [Acidimicrobiales bacterium]